jgi:hypothetical protein
MASIDGASVLAITVNSEFYLLPACISGGTISIALAVFWRAVVGW